MLCVANSIEGIQALAVRRQIGRTVVGLVTRIDVANAGAKPDPLEFLISIFSDPVEDIKLRLDAAKAALPYFHGKVAEKGKKETKAEAARDGAKSGKFATLDNQLMS